MTLLGKVDESDGTKEEWPQYLRLDHFFASTDAGIFDSYRTYNLVRKLVSPVKPSEKSYVDLVKVLTDHFNPTPSETVQRFKFHPRFSNPGETIAIFVSELHWLSFQLWNHPRGHVERLHRSSVVSAIIRFSRDSQQKP